METLFTVCFGVGAGFVILSFLFGEVFGMIDLNFDIDLDFDFGTGVSPLKPQLLAVFLTVFGGCGMLLYDKTVLWVVVSVSCLLGLAIAFLIFRFVIVPLSKVEAVAVEKQNLIGKNAKITEFIPQGGYGKITYYADGNTYSAPAKSEDGEEIKKNTSVVIAYIDKNTYYVRKEG